MGLNKFDILNFYFLRKVLQNIIGIMFFPVCFLFLLRNINKSRFYKIPILCYHRVINGRQTWRNLSCYDLTFISVSVNKFKKQIRSLSKKYTFISLNNLIDSLLNNKKLPNNSIVITFDDGFKDIYKNALPILNKYNVKADVFCSGNISLDPENSWVLWHHHLYYLLDNTRVSRFVLPEYSNVEYRLDTVKEKIRTIKNLQSLITDNHNNNEKSILEELERTLHVKVDKNIVSDFYLSKKEILEMQNNGFTFGAHTSSHLCLTDLDEKEIIKEVTYSKNKLEHIIQNQIKYFAYPFGHKKSFNKEIINILKRNGYTGACTTMDGLNDIGSNPFELKRIMVPSSSIPFLYFKICGISTFIKNLFRIS